MGRGKVISCLFALILFMNGCAMGHGKGEMIEPNSEGTELEKMQEFYFTIEETILPSPDKFIEVPDGGHVLLGELALLGERIICTASVYDREHQNTNFYILFLEYGAQAWKSIDVLNSAFEYEGVKYDGINSQICSAADDEMYTQAYIQDRGSFLCKLESESIREIVCAVPEEFKEEWDSLNGVFAGDKDGNFYSFSTNGNMIYCYDSNLNNKTKMEASKYVYGIIQAEAGADVYWYGIGADNKPIIGNVNDEQILVEGIKGLATEFYADVSADDTIMLTDTQNVWKVSDGIPQKVFQFGENGYLINQMYGIQVNEQDEILLLTKMDGDFILLRMKETEKPAEKQEVVMVCASQHWGLNKSIARFNRKNPQYHLSVMLPEKGEDEKDFRNRLQMEISSGRGPDILGDDMVLNPSEFVKHGYLECVDDVFEDRSLYLDAALENAQVNDKLYGVPYECTFDMVAYSSEVVGERTAWTLPDLVQTVHDSDAEVLQEGMDGVRIVEKYALSDDSNALYVDWEEGESHLTERPFLELLAFAKNYADDGKGEKKAFAKHITTFDRLSFVKDIYSYFEEGVAFLGYPRAEGNGIYVNSRMLYLNAGSECKEGAKAFLRFVVSEEEQQKYITYDATEQMIDEGLTVLNGNFVQFPVALKAFDALVELELEKDKKNIVYTDMGKIQTDMLYTDEMIEQFYFLLEHAEQGNYYAQAIFNIVSEELTPFFAGSVSADEAAEKLDNRVQLYLDETHQRLR